MICWFELFIIIKSRSSYIVFVYITHLFFDNIFLCCAHIYAPQSACILHNAYVHIRIQMFLATDTWWLLYWICLDFLNKNRKLMGQWNSVGARYKIRPEPRWISHHQMPFSERFRCDCFGLNPLYNHWHIEMVAFVRAFAVFFCNLFSIYVNTYMYKQWIDYTTQS